MNEPISNKADAPPAAKHQPAYRQKSVLWWAMVCVPVIVVLGLLSGQLSGSGADDPWFEALVKPDIYPPGWLFGVVLLTSFRIRNLRKRLMFFVPIATLV